MGMLADYMAVDDATLNAMTGQDTDAVSEMIEDLEDSGADVYSMDKLWDILHLVLTGVSASTPIEDDPLSEAVVGVHVFDGDDFIAATKAAELPRIVAAIDAVDWDGLRGRLSFEALRKAGTYPRLSETTPAEEDDLWRQVSGEFLGLCDFYHRVVGAGGNVIVSIY